MADKTVLLTCNGLRNINPVEVPETASLKFQPEQPRMSRIVYVNGAYVPEEEARVSPFDRGYLFGDGAYEVTPVVNGRLLDADRMLARMENSLAALGIAMPVSRAEFLTMHEELIARNGLPEGIIYVQITRGVAERDFPFPERAEPVMFAFPKAMPIIDNPRVGEGISVQLVDEQRWRRRDIKSIALLAQVLSRQQAAQAGAAEGWMVENGLVTEGCSSSAYIVKGDRIITSPLELDGVPRILPGIRRAILLEIAQAEGMEVELRPFSPREAFEADEAFQSAATFGVMPVVRIDGHVIGSGRPGPLTMRLRELFFARLEG